MMRTSFLALALLTLSSAARAWNRGDVEVFAVLPDGATGPEGLEVGPDGTVYVTTFGFNSKGADPGPGKLYVYDRHGRLVRQVTIANSTSHLLGVRLQAEHKLLVIDFGGQQVLSVDPRTGASAVFMTVPPDADPNVTAGLNDLTFDSAGNVYVSDSFRGVIWKTGPAGGLATEWVKDALLKPNGVPPFGANGLRFDRGEKNLYVANTANDTIVQVPVVAGVAGKPVVFTNSINGADGLLIDRDGNLWVCANQADEIVVVDRTGKAIAKLGDFDGIHRGSPEKLLFPASPRFFGDDLLVTNLALNTDLFGFHTVDTGWSQQVSRYTVSRLRARIPKPDDD